MCPRLCAAVCYRAVRCVCNGGSCVRDGVASFFYFSTYEYLKKAWTPKARRVCECAGCVCTRGHPRQGVCVSVLAVFARVDTQGKASMQPSSPRLAIRPLLSNISHPPSSCCVHAIAVSVGVARQGEADAETCDMRHATCDMRHATCDMRHDAETGCLVAAGSMCCLTSCKLPHQVSVLFQPVVLIGRVRKGLGLGQHSWQGA